MISFAFINNILVWRVYERENQYLHKYANERLHPAYSASIKVSFFGIDGVNDGDGGGGVVGGGNGSDSGRGAGGAGCVGGGGGVVVVVGGGDGGSGGGGSGGGLGAGGAGGGGGGEHNISMIVCQDGGQRGQRINRSLG